MSNESRQKMNERRKKVYVLDTTVLIDNPHLPYELRDGDIVIPIGVLWELDGLKKSDVLRVAQAAREVSRLLDRLGSYGDLREGVALSSSVRVILYPYFEPVSLLASEGDNRILGGALHFRVMNPEAEIVVMTTDVNLRVAARTLGFVVSFNADASLYSNASDKYMREVEKLKYGYRNPLGKLCGRLRLSGAFVVSSFYLIVGGLIVAGFAGLAWAFVLALVVSGVSVLLIWIDRIVHGFSGGGGSSDESLFIATLDAIGFLDHNRKYD